MNMKLIIIIISLLFFNVGNAKTSFFLDTSEVSKSDYSTLNSNTVESSIQNERLSLNKCSQVLTEVTISGGSKVVMNCITTIKKVSSIERSEIKVLAQRMSVINSSLMELNQSRSFSNIKTQNKIKENKIEITKLNQDYLEHKETILVITNTINKIKYSEAVRATKSRRRFNRLEKAHNETVYELSILEEGHNETVYELNRLGISILQNTNSIIILEGRVDTIETNLNYLMDEYTDGNLKTISFYGPKLGMTSINNSKYSVIGFEYERFLDPKYNMSLFVDVSKYDGNKKDTYSTLNGVSDQEIETNNTFYSIGLGARKFIKKIDKYNFYVGGSLGYATGDEKTFLGNTFLGVEAYRKFNKISLELGYTYFNKIKHKRVIFNPLGYSENFEETKGESGVSLSLKYSTR